MTQQADISSFGEFSDVDASGMLDRLVTFLDFVEAMPQVQAMRSKTYELLRLDPGARVVDVGCGTGTVVAGLARLGGDAAGIDMSGQMITVATRRHPDLEFHVASAESLPFDDGSMGAYRAERVVQHVADPGVALAEARRVLAPGGRILMIDQDWDAWVIDSDDVPTTRAVLRAFSDSIAQSWMGRRFRRHLLTAGFDDIDIGVHTYVYDDGSLRDLIPSIAAPAVTSAALTSTQADEWVADQFARIESGDFFAAIPMFVASATQGRVSPTN